MDIKLGLDALADEVWEWHQRELGEGTLVGKAAKVAEEAGEFIGSVLKSTEPRPDAAEHLAAARLEMADIILATLGAARALGFGSIDEAVLEKWEIVRERRFATYPGEESLLAETCWCGAEVGPRLLGDKDGRGCQKSFSHDWTSVQTPVGKAHAALYVADEAHQAAWRAYQVANVRDRLGVPARLDELIAAADKAKGARHDYAYALTQATKVQ